MASAMPFDVTDSVIEIFTDGDSSGRSLFVHQGLLASSSEYMINPIAAAAQVAAEMPVFTRQNNFIVVDVPYNVMAIFARWLYTARKDSFKHEFTAMFDILQVWQWTKQHLFNAEFRDGLINEMVKLVTTWTKLRGPDHAAAELIRSLKSLNTDIEGHMARFLAEWFLSCTFTTASVYNDFSAILTINGPHPSLCQAIIQAKLQEKMVASAGTQKQLPPQGVEDLSPQPYPFKAISALQKHLEAAHSEQVQASNARELPSNLDDSVEGPKKGQHNRKEDDAEVLKYIVGPEEDFTKMPPGHDRSRTRDRVRRRMLKAKSTVGNNSLLIKKGSAVVSGQLP